MTGFGLAVVMAAGLGFIYPSVPAVAWAGIISGSPSDLLEARESPGVPSRDSVALRMLDSVTSPAPEALRVLFWNLENFFDFRNDSTSVSDADFSASGERRWTRKRFYTKCNAVAKTLLWAGSPDIAAFAEVENAFVLRRLLAATPLYKTDYHPVHYDSPDPRGIDVALLYRADKLKLLESKPLRVYRPDAPDSLLLTRDILMTRFRQRASGAEFFLLVCHLPSKYGGAEASAPKRAAAVRRLRSVADSLAAGPLRAFPGPLATVDPQTLPDSLTAGPLRPDAPVRFLPVPLILCGDFNDTPDGPVFQPLDSVMTNLAALLAAEGQGTLRYAGQWDLIDQFWVFPAPAHPDTPAATSPQASLPSSTTRGSLVSSGSAATPTDSTFSATAAPPDVRMTILRPPFLLTRDTAHGGLKPLRTYSGPRYLGGVSDHLPILLLVPP